MASTTLDLLRLVEAKSDPRREKGRRAILAAVRGFVSDWRESFWEGWRWPEAGVLRRLIQSTFELDLAVERERALWRETVGLPPTRGRFLQGEWRRRIERLRSLDDVAKQQLAASLRGRYMQEVEKEPRRTGSAVVVGETIEPPATTLATFREEFRAAFLEAMYDGAADGARQVGFVADWTLRDAQAVAHMDRYAGVYGDRITKLVPMEWQVDIRKAVIHGLDEGLGAADMARDIQGAWSNLRGYEALRIARTEAVRSHMEGRRTAYATANVHMLVWITSGRGNVCPVCTSRHGRRYPVDSPELPPAHPDCNCDAVAAPEETERLRQQAFAGLEL